MVSIHAPREGRDVGLREDLAGVVDVSIHAPREGRDKRAHRRQARQQVSIHAPREGRDGIDYVAMLGSGAFQSTRPVKGATVLISVSLPMTRGFNPRAP